MARCKIEVANQVIDLETVYNRSCGLCQMFYTNKPENIKVSIKQEDIDQAKEQHRKIYGSSTEPWDGFIEFSIVFRKISEELIEHDTFAFHGAVIGLHNQAYLFTAPSGTGKTTHIIKWVKKCAETIVINGDKPFIKIRQKGMNPLVFGSPWAGKENLYTNTAMPLKSVILMERADDNEIEKIPFVQAFTFLLGQVYRPNDESKMRKTLQLLKKMDGCVTFWRFRCNNFKEDCFDVAYNALVKDER